MIELITGPMLSGKTTEMIRRLERYAIAGRKVAIFRPSIDSRENLTHSSYDHNIPIRIAEYIWQFIDLAKEFDVIGVDEVQFFDEEYVDVFDELAKDKLIICSGLNATAERGKWSTVEQLVSKVDDIVFVHAVCNDCGSQTASRTYYTGGKKQQVLIGGAESYIALCRSCYDKRISD